MPPPKPRQEMTIKDGMMVLDRNSFDFVRTPSKDAFLSPYASGGGKRGSSTKEKESGRLKIQRALMNIKKQRNMSTIGNKNLSLVKAEDDLQGSDM
jgi:hypothetical protein